MPNDLLNVSCDVDISQLLKTKHHKLSYLSPNLLLLLYTLPWFMVPSSIQVGKLDQPPSPPHLQIPSCLLDILIVTAFQSPLPVHPCPTGSVGAALAQALILALNLNSFL